MALIYYSANATTQKVLNGNTWEDKEWTGLTNFNGQYIWSDGTHIYYSMAETKMLNGDEWINSPNPLVEYFSPFTYSLWSDGTHIYISTNGTNIMLNDDTWLMITWDGFSNINGNNVWTDGTQTYYSYDTTHKVLIGKSWEDVTWGGLDSFNGSGIWSDGSNIYFYSSTEHKTYAMSNNIRDYDLTVTYGSDFAPNQNLVVTRAGHTFKEWNTRADGTGTSYGTTPTPYNVAGDLVLYAIWE